MEMRGSSDVAKAEMEREMRIEMDEYEDAVVLYDRIAKRNQESVRIELERVERRRERQTAWDGRG